MAAPIKEPEKPQCQSVLCSKNTDEKLNKLIQEVAESCNCCSSKKVNFNLCSFCEAYRNYDPATYGIIQCIINKLSNPCYKYNCSFQQILNNGCCNVCQKSNFNIYSFLYDVCYGCNGCLDDCYIQNGNTIVYAEPLAVAKGPMLTSTA